MWQVFIMSYLDLLPDDIYRKIWKQVYSAAISDIKYHSKFICEKARIYKDWFIEEREQYGEEGDEDYPHYKTFIDDMDECHWDDVVMDEYDFDALVSDRIHTFPAYFLGYWAGVSEWSISGLLENLEEEQCIELLRKILEPNWGGFKEQVEKDWISQGVINYYCDGLDNFYIVSRNFET